MILSVTGHRPHLTGGYSGQPRIEHLALVTLAEMAPRLVCTGMAQGWDQAVASACIVLDIPFVAILPGFQPPYTQDDRWPAPARARYAQLLAAAVEVERRPWPGARREYHDRDWRLVQRCDQVLALWNGDPRTGTGMTVRMAQDAGRPVRNVWKEWRA